MLRTLNTFVGGGKTAVLAKATDGRSTFSGTSNGSGALSAEIFRFAHSAMEFREPVKRQAFPHTTLSISASKQGLSLVLA